MLFKIMELSLLPGNPSTVDPSITGEFFLPVSCPTDVSSHSSFKVGIYVLIGNTLQLASDFLVSCKIVNV